MLFILLVIIIIPFVFAYSPGSRLTSSTGALKKGEGFFGYNLNDGATVQELGRRAAIDEWLKTGYPPFDAQTAQTLLLSRVIKLNMADKLGIPSPTEIQLASYIPNLVPFQDTKGKFSQKKFEEFDAQFAMEEGNSKDFLTECIVERWRLDQLNGTLETSGFYLPTSLARQNELLNTRYETQIAVLRGTPDAAMTVTEEEAKVYFEANRKSYRSPEKRAGIVYRLGMEKFADQVTAPSEEQLQKFFDSISMRFINWQVKDEKGNVTGAEPKAPTLTEHREETLKLYKETKAARVAAEMVDAIVQKLYADKITPGSKAWNETVKASGLEVQTLELSAQVPDDTGTLETLFELSLKAQPYSEAFQTEKDGRFVLLTNIEESKSLGYEAAAAQVKSDALKTKQQKAIAEMLAAKVENLKRDFAKAEYEEFTEIAKQSGFAVITPEPFTLSKPAAEISSPEIVKGLLSAKAGELLTTTDISRATATVVWLKNRQLPTQDSPTGTQATLEKQLGRLYGNLNTLSVLNEWAEKNARK